MSIDPRLMERRREVAEERARRNVGRLIRFLVVLGSLGAIAWILLSPLLSVKEVVVTGIEVSSAHSTLADQGVVTGTPMILIRSEGVERALEEDPWVGEARIDLEWPDRVLVSIEERHPVAWVETGQGWSRFAVDGVALPSAAEPDEALPWVEITAVPSEEAGGSAHVLGALRFAATLPLELRSGTTIRVEDNDELWAEVAGYEVRLGRPVEMEAKARSLAALLDEEPAAGSVLTLIAPTHPAAAPPESNESTAEGSEEDS